MTTPILSLPNFFESFVIQTDSSGFGIGAVLSQSGHPVAYFTKQLNPKLQASSTYIREMHAITEAIRKWQQYLLGNRFTIQTDRQRLRSLLNQTVQTLEQQQWLVKLLGFDFEITCKPKRDNGPVDAFSQLPEGTWHAIQAVYKPVIGLLSALKTFY